MPESFTHSCLVKKALKYIKDHSLVRYPQLIKVDSFNSDDRYLPPIVGGYRPDIYYQETLEEICVIGEAKTGPDLERSHSKSQISAFLEYCKTWERSIFLLAVPWYYETRGKNLVRFIQKECRATDVKILVLPKLLVEE